MKGVPATETVKSDICLSPSWSDHGEKGRKKEKKRQEREQKDLEKRRKQAEEGQKATDSKNGKRLSKRPPPAAMDTQKMPAELRTSRRNSLRSLLSGQSSSREGSRRNSGEERGLSATSIASFIPRRRSHSEQRRKPNGPSMNGETPESSQPTEPSRPVLPSVAPRLPSFRWSSRKPSKNDSNSVDVDDGEFLAFAYQLDDSAFECESQEIKPQDGKPGEGVLKGDGTIPTGVCAITGSATERTVSASPDPDIPPQETITPQQQNGRGAQPNNSKPEDASIRDVDDRLPVEESAGIPVGIASDQKHRSRQIPSSLHRPQLPDWPSHDGSSYVHKQRMYQQQLSIAGFEDEQALQLVNEQAAKEELQHVKRAEQPIRQTGTINTSQEEKVVVGHVASNDRSPSLPQHSKDSRRKLNTSPSRRFPPQKPAQATPSPLKAVSPAPQDSDGGQQEQQTHSLKRAGEPLSTQKPQAGKTDKILGFRRRSKQATADIVEPESKVQVSVERASDNVDVSDMHEPSTSRSRIERMSAQIPFRTRRETTGPSTKPSTGSDMKGAGRGHSRTRTAPSQMMNAKSDSANTVPVATSASPSSALKKAENQAHYLSGQRAEATSPNKSKAKRTESPSRLVPKSKADSAAFAISYTEEIDSPTKSNGQVAHDVGDSKATKDPELVVESLTGDGIVRKTSITRSRSNPQLQTTTATDSLPSLDFLPQLKHQPLVKSSRRSSGQQQSADPTTSVRFQIPTPASTLSTAYKSPLAPSPPDLALMPRSPLRIPSNFHPPSFNRSSTSVSPFAPGKGATIDGLDAKPIAKLFVICCKCKFWHDLPSKLYEAMALPKELHKRDDGQIPGAGKKKSPLSNGKAKVAEARLETAVKCPWCEHAMTTWCCAGWTTVVYLHERHH